MIALLATVLLIGFAGGTLVMLLGIYAIYSASVTLHGDDNRR